MHEKIHRWLPSRKRNCKFVVNIQKKGIITVLKRRLAEHHTNNHFNFFKVHTTMRPLLKTLGDVKSLTLNRLKMLSYLTQLFPMVFKEKLCEQLLDILVELLDNIANIYKGNYYL